MAIMTSWVSRRDIRMTSYRYFRFNQL